MEQMMVRGRPGSQGLLLAPVLACVGLRCTLPTVCVQCDVVFYLIGAASERGDPTPQLPAARSHSCSSAGESVAAG